MKKQSEKMSQTLKVLGNSIRLDILEYLRNGESCVCDIYDHLRLPQNLVSHHLALLKKNDFIKARKDGKWVYYSLNRKRIDELQKLLTKIIETKERPSKC